jgi:hypothetical protein
MHEVGFMRMRLRERAGEPIAAHSLAVFRIAFGLLLAWEAGRYLSSGWIEKHFVEPAFHFTYFVFGWVRPPPQPWLDRLFVALGGAGLCIAAGFRTRLAAALLFVGFAWVFLLEQARYLNHFYLVLLLALLLAWLPTDGAWSWRAWREGGRSAPRGALWLLRAQLAIVYGYAAIAKLNGDWLQAEPLRSWLASRREMPWIGPLLAQEWVAWAMSYAGLLLDLLAVPLLLIRKTRARMFAALCAFHVSNHFLFDIGIFPWLAIGATTLFFAPDWPARLIERLGRRRRVSSDSREESASSVARPLGFALALLWLAIQLLVPLRHFLHPGNVSWTEEGHRFAWHMKLRSKQAQARFVVTRPDTGERLFVDPLGELADWQVAKMADRPDMVLQYAHHLAKRHAVIDPVTGARRLPEVRALVDCSLNGRAPQPLIDPDRDLARVERSLRTADWIVPLREPLPPAWASGRVEFEE